MDKQLDQIVSDLIELFPYVEIEESPLQTLTIVTRKVFFSPYRIPYGSLAGHPWSEFCASVPCDSTYSYFCLPKTMSNDTGIFSINGFPDLWNRILLYLGPGSAEMSNGNTVPYLYLPYKPDNALKIFNKIRSYVESRDMGALL